MRARWSAPLADWRCTRVTSPHPDTAPAAIVATSAQHVARRIPDLPRFGSEPSAAARTASTVRWRGTQPGQAPGFCEQKSLNPPEFVVDVPPPEVPPPDVPPDVPPALVPPLVPPVPVAGAVPPALVP